jgi:hypothetical protein
MRPGLKDVGGSSNTRISSYTGAFDELPVLIPGWRTMVTIPPEIVNGVLVNAISATGRMLVGPALGMRSRRSAADLDIASWFDTYQLTGDGPDLAVPDADQIETVLRRDEAQAVLQELLAARLTDAPEADISQCRAEWELSFAQDTRFKLDTEVVGKLFDYYDTKIGEFVARLEGQRSADTCADQEQRIQHQDQARAECDRAAHGGPERQAERAHRGKLPDQLSAPRRGPSWKAGTTGLRAPSPRSHCRYLRPHKHYRGLACRTSSGAASR